MNDCKKVKFQSFVKSNDRIVHHAWPHLINEGRFRLLAAMLTLSIPGAHLKKSQHVHLIDLFHPPARFEQCVIGGIDIFR